MRIGSLFTGYGGLDQAVSSVTGAETVWVSDVDKGANKILAHRYPNVPNLGDITTIKWVPDCPVELGGCGKPATIQGDRSGWECHDCQMLWPTAMGRTYWPEVPEPIDILTGGFPCQDLSHAGKRAGLKEGTRSGLWSHMARAIKDLNPRLVVVENVRGLLSADAPGDVEPCPWCVGNGSTVNLRALGVVLADLADLGFDAEWVGLRCADVGGCHGRFRVFLIAYPNGIRPEWAGNTRSGGARLADNGGGTDVALLPTPVVNDMGAGKTPSEWSEWSETMRQRHGNGNGHGASLSIEAQLLPTPTRRDHKDHEIRREPHRPDSVDTLSRALTDFGEYGPAVARWEQVLGRPAPTPTEPTGRGKARRLSAEFVSWMMGLPDGWVTDVPSLSRSEALKALGNGVVPQQAAAALTHLLGRR